MPVYAMLDNSLFDKYKHPLETLSSGNNEKIDMGTAWSFSTSLNRGLHMSWVKSQSLSRIKN